MSSLKLDTTKRNAVRLALVTGSTVAAIIGAQSLIALDSAPKAAASVSQPSDSSSQLQFQQPDSEQSFFGDDGSSIVEIAPGVFAIRPAGQDSQSFSTTNGQSTQPRIRTRSSR